MKSIDRSSYHVPHKAIAACVYIFVFLFSAHSLAQNLVVNATFDTHVDNWEDINLELEAIWDEDDADGDPDSGSANALHDLETSGRAMLLQCVPVKPDTKYSFGGSLKLITTSSEFDSASFLLYPKTDPNCFGAPNGASASAFVDVVGVWTITSSSITTPPSTQAIDLRVTIEKSGVGDVRAAADNIWLIDYETYSNWVFSNSFEAGKTAPWLRD